MPPVRERLPNRRPALTQDLDIGGCHVAATIGFDPEARPREVFLSGAKVGSEMAGILDDASVVISIALQHNIAPAAVPRVVLTWITPWSSYHSGSMAKNRFQLYSGPLGLATLRGSWG